VLGWKWYLNTLHSAALKTLHKGWRFFLSICRCVATSKNVRWTHTASGDRKPIAGSGAEPQWGLPKPPEAENLSALDAERKQQIRLIFRILQTGESSSKRDRHVSLPIKTRRIHINLRKKLWQKWGGHAPPPSPPRGDATVHWLFIVWCVWCIESCTAWLVSQGVFVRIVKAKVSQGLVIWQILFTVFLTVTSFTAVPD